MYGYDPKMTRRTKASPTPRIPLATMTKMWTVAMNGAMQTRISSTWSLSRQLNPATTALPSCIVI
jgi:hypothetical protein